MQLHQLQPKNKNQKRKRVGRGGKRGTFSGHGSKGQKARAGTRIRPGFRGGDNPIWKLFPKQRGATKKVDIKKAKFQVHQEKANVVNLGVINSSFEDGAVVSARMLVKKGIVKGGHLLLEHSPVLVAVAKAEPIVEGQAPELYLIDFVLFIAGGLENEHGTTF